MTSEPNLKEYVVTLHNFDDLESFYNDMETEGGDLYIPNRAVDIANRRPVSRNTHYMLSDREAEQLRQDPRVLAVELTLEARGIERRPVWSQSSTLWSKSASVLTNQKNWGLLRVSKGAQIPNWGVGGTTEASGDITVPFSGKNVDVVITDEPVDGTHPEFAKNVDGSGGSRFVPFNWFSLDQDILGNKVQIATVARSNGIATITTKDWHGLKDGTKINIVCSSHPSFNATNVVVSFIPYYPGPNPPNNAVAYLTTFTYAQAGPDVAAVAATGVWSRTYDYTIPSSTTYHGTFCAGITAGNTHGWARDANIYNFDNLLTYGDAAVYDYIRLWHNAKQINPATGVKNPTVVNSSWALQYTIRLDRVKSINYRGTISYAPFTLAQVKALGVGWGYKYDAATNTYLDAIVVPARDTAEEADIADCIAAGVTIVAAAGNEGMKIDLSGGVDYNNSIDYFGFTFTGTRYDDTIPYNRGAVPGAAPGVICVGAVGVTINGLLEEKADYSQCGPRVDVFAPGTNITSIVPGIFSNSSVATAPDSRNSSFKIRKSNGTSFASPQIAGIIATMLEVAPSMTPAAALNYITSSAKTGQLIDIAASPQVELVGLNGAQNRYAFAKYPSTISITPNTTAVIPLQSVTYSITITDVPDGSLVYLTESGTSVGTDFDDGVTQFVLTVTSGVASLTRTVRAGITGSRTSIMKLRTGGYDGNIQATASTVTVSVGDFAASSGSFTIDAQGKANFTITPSLDSTIEGAETFTLSIRTGSVSGNIVKTSGTITINDA